MSVERARSGNGWVTRAAAISASACVGSAPSRSDSRLVWVASLPTSQTWRGR